MMERNEKIQMLKQVSEVCVDINFYAAPSYQVPTAEPLPIGMVQEREMPPYTDVTDTLDFQNQHIISGSCKTVNIRPDNVFYTFNSLMQLHCPRTTAYYIH